ncbi:MAG: hypothetical protein QM733_21910 [Ilumatobacteraceae bacterium]
MAAMTIRHVPVEVRDELAVRAARRGQSLQEFMLGELTRLAGRPAVADLVAEISERKARLGVEIDRKAILADRDADRA